MAIEVHTSNRVHEFEEANGLDVEDGHLLVQRTSAGQSSNVAIFKPGTWSHASVIGSSKVTT